MSFKYNHFLLSACLPVIAFTTFTLPSANAGFEWSPPEVKEAKPEATITPEHVEMIDNVSVETPSNTDIKKEQTPPEINLFPLNESKEKITSNTETVILPHNSDNNGNNATATEDISEKKTESFDVIEGFGSDMPLALALRQIVPAEYAFSFGRNVNAGENISWTGGKPWNEILKDALAPLNIKFEIKNKRIILNLGDTMKSSSLNIQEMVTEKKTLETAIVLDEVIHIEDANISNNKVLIEPEIKAESEPTAIISLAPAEEIAIEQVKKKVSDNKHQQEDLISTPTSKNEVILLEHEVLIEDKEEEVAENLTLDPPDIENATTDTTEKIVTKDNIMEIQRNSILDPGQSEDNQLQAQEISEESSNDLKTSKDKATQAPLLRNNPSNDIKIWEAKLGSDIKNILDKWSEEEQILFKWLTTKKYKLDKDVFISGTFENAVKILFSKGLRKAPEYSIIESETYELRVGEK